MRRKLLWLVLAAAIVRAGEVSGPRQPVLVELFTSEGCSSCPPADRLLEQLDQAQPIAGAQIIVLSEHVDYWNHLGWADPYSSAALTLRQQIYARHFSLDDPYTPEMVVDGSTQFVGNDVQKAGAAIRAATQAPKVDVHLRAAPADDSSVTVDVDPLPPGKTRKANVYFAMAADSGSSDVQGGENRGRRLHYVAIVKEIQHAGKISENSGFEKQIAVPAGSRLIVFVQEGDSGRVWGAAMYRRP